MTGALELPEICATLSTNVPEPSLGRLNCTAPIASSCADATPTRRPPGGVSGAGAAWPPPEAKFHQPTLTGSSAEAGGRTAPGAPRPIEAGGGPVAAPAPPPRPRGVKKLIGRAPFLVAGGGFLLAGGRPG